MDHPEALAARPRVPPLYLTGVQGLNSHSLSFFRAVPKLPSW